MSASLTKQSTNHHGACVGRVLVCKLPPTLSFVWDHASSLTEMEGTERLVLGVAAGMNEVPFHFSKHSVGFC